MYVPSLKVYRKAPQVKVHVIALRCPVKASQGLQQDKCHCWADSCWCCCSLGLAWRLYVDWGLYFLHIVSSIIALAAVSCALAEHVAGHPEQRPAQGRMLSCRASQRPAMSPWRLWLLPLQGSEEGTVSVIGSYVWRLSNAHHQGSLLWSLTGSSKPFTLF